jgi:glycosyltransferase involved in cell wall biosynthesis
VHVGIDGSNLRAGGGVTHIVQLLGAAEPSRHGIHRVTVWAPRATLEQIADRPWLEKSSQPVLEGSLLRRLAWRRARLPRLAEGCDVLFVPGGGFRGRVGPYVTMSRNMLPFDAGERARYGWSRTGVRLRILHRVQRSDFRRADGVMFLTDHAREVVTRSTGPLAGLTVTVPHGVDARFLRAPRPQRPIERYDFARPFRLLYVSIIDLYKHQDRVAEAVARARAGGLPVALDLVGPGYPPSLRRLRQVAAGVDPGGTWLRCVGAVAHADLPGTYAAADGFVFASTCENMPNVLLEAMASGLPIACSSRPPMPQVLGDGGVYFDPLSESSMTDALVRLVCDAGLRAELAAAASRTASRYSWSRCADDTFAFLGRVARTRRGPAR